MKKEIKDSLPYWIACACLRCCNCKFYKISNQNFDDVFMSAYIGILEGLQNDTNLKKINLFDKNSVSKADYLKLVNYGRCGMRKYFFSKSVFPDCSLDKPIIDEEKSKTFGETIPFYDLYYFDYENVKNLLQKELLNYTLQERKIIILYIDGITKQDLMKKFKISFEELGSLIFSFRKKFKEVLLKNNIFDFSFDGENKEFLSYQVYQDKERRKELKNGLVVGRDIKLIELVKTLSLDELSDFLGLSISVLQDIIKHKKGASKFWLYQAQKIRKKFFPDLSFEELFEVC